MARDDDGFITADDYKDAFLACAAPTVARQQCGQSGWLDEVATIAARYAYADSGNLEIAIRAYLTSATPPEVAGLLADIENSAWNCDEWPDWLHEIVEKTNEVSDRLDMSAEQAHAYSALSATALRLSAGGGIPVGWKLVPVEPTFEMQIAGRDAIIDASDDDNLDLSIDDADACYRAMLAASPTVEGS